MTIVGSFLHILRIEFPESFIPDEIPDTQLHSSSITNDRDLLAVEELLEGVKGHAEVPPRLPQSYPKISDAGVPFDELVTHLAQVCSDQSILHQAKPPRAGLIPDLDACCAKRPQIPIDRFRRVAEFLAVDLRILETNDLGIARARIQEKGATRRSLIIRVETFRRVGVKKSWITKPEKSRESRPRAK